VYVQFTSTGRFEVRPVTEEECPSSFSTAEQVIALKTQVKELRFRVEDMERSLYAKRKEVETMEAVKDARLRAAQHEALHALLLEIPQLDVELEEMEKVLEMSRRQLFHTKWMWSDVKEDVWPLMAETQSEVASRGLVDFMSKLRLEATGVKATMKSALPDRVRSSSSRGSKRLSRRGGSSATAIIS
jgi:hypothetical protein